MFSWKTWKVVTTCLVCLIVLLLVYSIKVRSDLVASSQSQNPSALSSTELIWQRTFGGAGDDRAFCIVSSGDGGFLVVGSSSSFSSGKTFGWIVRTDQEGNTLWNRTYEEGEGSEFRSALWTEDGFLLVGNTFSLAGDESGWVVRIDEQGNALWNLTVQSKEAKLFSVAKVQDGFILVGLTYLSGRNDSDALAIKTDTSGRILWNKSYGGSGDDVFRAVIATGNNEIVAAGYTNSFGHGDYDFWLAKMDGNGGVLWSNTYGGAGADMAYSLAIAKEGYVIAGETHSFGNGDAKAFVVKTDFSGNLLWQIEYGGQQYDTAATIIPSSSGGYVVAGFTFSFGAGQRNFWIFNIDDSGEILWSRTQGGKDFDEAYSIVEVAPNQFVAAGWTNSFGEGKYDYYVVQMKALVPDHPLRPRGLFYYGLAVLAVALLATMFGVSGMFDLRKTRQTNVTKTSA